MDLTGLELAKVQAPQNIGPFSPGCCSNVSGSFPHGPVSSFERIQSGLGCGFGRFWMGSRMLVSFKLVWGLVSGLHVQCPDLVPFIRVVNEPRDCSVASLTAMGRRVFSQLRRQNSERNT